jgi:hypothetical protein
MSVDTSGTQPRSHLFTVRVWEEEVGAGQTELRGKVQLLTSGEVHYFREWTALVPLLLAMLSESQSNGQQLHTHLSPVNEGNQPDFNTQKER